MEKSVKEIQTYVGIFFHWPTAKDRNQKQSVRKQFQIEDEAKRSEEPLPHVGLKQTLLDKIIRIKGVETCRGFEWGKRLNQ